MKAGTPITYHLTKEQAKSQAHPKGTKTAKALIISEDEKNKGEYLIRLDEKHCMLRINGATEGTKQGQFVLREVEEEEEKKDAPKEDAPKEEKR